MRSVVAWLMLAAAFGCGVKAETASEQREARLACESNAQCGTGRCLAAFGVCSQNQGDLTRLLFEVTPPPSDPVYGGASYLYIADLSMTDLPEVPGRGIAAGWFELNIKPRVPVSGSVSAAPDQTACLSRARSTLPVSLTFTPRERLFGLPVSSYDLSTQFDEASGEYTFHGSLPPGHYDVYMRPDTAELSASCVAIPQIFRDRTIGDVFQLEQPPPAPLQLTLPWREDLEGWLLDMVHPVTGEVISNRVHLSAANRSPEDPGKLRTTLYYSRAAGDFITDGDQLVRLTPPPGVTAGTVLLQRSGIVLATPGEGQIGEVFNFGTKVDFRAWVWKEGEYDAPVPGTVNFAARDLDDVADGVPTAFDASAVVDERGEIRLQLLPGRYRVRVTPPGIELANLGSLSSVESSVTVWPSESGSGLVQGGVQGGQVIEVPAAIYLSGSVLADPGGRPLEGAEVLASASSSSQLPCSLPAGGDPTGSCDSPRAAVLRRALARDPFVPRTRSTLSAPNGDFRITGLDCGQCEPGAGARFDLSVRPPAELGLPWLVLRAYSLDSNESMRDPLRVPAPVAHALRLTYGDPTQFSDGNGTVPPLADALVRVYALLDDHAHIVSDESALVPCVTFPTLPNRPCVDSVLQVAELRSGKNGELLLLLPPTIE